MDEERTDSPCQRTISSENVHQPKSNDETDVPAEEAALSFISENAQADHIGTIFKCIDESEEMPVLQDTQQSIDSLSLNTQPLTIDSGLPKDANNDKPVLDTVSHQDTAPSTPLCKAFSTGNVANHYENYDLKSATHNVCVDKLTARSTDSIQNTHTFKEQLCNPVEYRGLEDSVEDARPYQSSTFRPTLADDSRAVKISLPTNPINLMQTNAQFLNKSRHFLNFITEKSTNIVEKALHSQQLSVKYNSVVKSKDINTSERKGLDSSNCVTQESLIAAKSILPETSNDDKADDPQFSCIDRYQNQSNVVQHDGQDSYIGFNGSTSDNKQDYNIPKSPSQIYATDEVNRSNVLPNTLEVASLCTEMNGNVNSDPNSLTLNTFNTNGTITPTNTVQQDTNDSMNNYDANLKDGLLQHPAYLTLLRDYADLKSKNMRLVEQIDQLEDKNRVLEGEKSGELFKIQIETLEKTVNRLTTELRSSVTSQETLRKEYNVANKERESMVMKYAVGEKQLIDSQRARDTAERKIKDLTKEQEFLQTKLRQAQGERTRICSILDGKCREISELQKEVERLKEDVKMRDVKLKWSQTKLKTEMDAQKETQQKLDKATARINEMKEECEQVRKESEESIRRFQQSEENKAVTLDQQLKEQQAQLILERHVTEDKEMLRLQLQKEVDTLKNRQQVLIEENNTLSLKIQDAEKNRLNNESNLSNLKVIADQRQKEIVDLLDKVSQFETLKVQLEHKEQNLETTKTEIEHLRSANEELQTDMRACRQREADMLDFTQKLTDKNVGLQSEFLALETKAKQLEEEHGPLHERIHGLIARIKELEESLTREQRTRTEECDILAKHLAEQIQTVQELTQKLEDSQGENAVLKRKQQLTVKELTREIQQCRKRLESYEATSPTNSLDIASRAGSSASLNTGDVPNGALSDSSAANEQPLQTLESSRQALIDRIIQLEKLKVQQTERLDFYEENTRELVQELQKKRKIIQNYILHESSGAMGGHERDRYKAELARHGGIMASVYNQRVSDDNMTLELSLEINQKLQEVLEDALLKNITLKDNLDTLGEEIARLTMQNQQRQISK